MGFHREATETEISTYLRNSSIKHCLPASITYQERKDFTSFAYKSDLSGMQRLLEIGLDPNLDSEAVLAVITNYNIEALNILLKHDLDSNMRDQDGDTLLHRALQTRRGIPGIAFEKKLQVIQQLLQAGANPNLPDKDGITPFIYSLGHVDNNYAIAKMMIAKGASINKPDSRGDTPLHYQVRRGTAEMTSYLIARGANVRAKNRSGQTPIYNALKSRNAKTTEILLRHGAEIKGLICRDYLACPFSPDEYLEDPAIPSQGPFRQGVPLRDLLLKIRPNEKY